MKTKTKKYRIIIRNKGSKKIKGKKYKSDKYYYLFKGLIIIIFLILYFIINNNIIKNNININKSIYNILKKRKKISNTNEKYFSCLSTMGKMENRYAVEFVEHYINLGIEKFYLGDDNFINGEKLSDVLQSYIDLGIVEIKDIRGLNISIEDFFQHAYTKLKDKCVWIAFYDFDEFLNFKDKNMTIKKYFSQEVFNKCDVVKIHWLSFYDNGLVHYENIPLKERFTEPDYNSDENRFHKSIIRGKNINGTIFNDRTGIHQPLESLFNMCDAEGNLANVPHGILGIPNYKYCYLSHYTMKTIEEFGVKIIRGIFRGTPYTNYSKRLKRFFKYNKFTPEKLELIEKILNTTFPQYHK